MNMKKLFLVFLLIPILVISVYAKDDVKNNDILNNELLSVQSEMMNEVTSVEQANELLKKYVLAHENKIVDKTEIIEKISWQDHYQGNSGVDPLRVNTMPTNTNNLRRGNAKVGQSIELWGSANGGTPPYNWELFVDNVSIGSGSTNNGRCLSVNHVFNTAGLKTVTLTVNDVSHSSKVKVHAALTREIEVAMAIEKGLLYLYKTATLYPDDRLYWLNGDYIGYGSIGSSLLAFVENGYLPNNDYQEDPYAETVQMGIDFLLTYREGTMAIPNHSDGIATRDSSMC